jgi:hypothetical protein
MGKLTFLSFNVHDIHLVTSMVTSLRRPWTRQWRALYQHGICVLVVCTGKPDRPEPSAASQPRSMPFPERSPERSLTASLLTFHAYLTSESTEQGCEGLPPRRLFSGCCSELTSLVSLTPFGRVGQSGAWDIQSASLSDRHCCRLMGPSPASVKIGDNSSGQQISPTTDHLSIYHWQCQETLLSSIPSDPTAGMDSQA